MVEIGYTNPVERRRNGDSRSFKKDSTHLAGCGGNAVRKRKQWPSARSAGLRIVFVILLFYVAGEGLGLEMVLL